ncbi:hypothetical protein [Aureibaculum conchae]|uniref:hypothetical protein n=1 Tax=Aureibaculum sp. 2308TA14-22 TaxID=3108392 RepID=UPI003390A7C3
MRKKSLEERSKILNTQYVFSYNNQVSIKIDKNIDKWYPINFQWVPILELKHDMNK